MEGGGLDADAFQNRAGQGDAVLGAPGGGSAFRVGGLAGRGQWAQVVGEAGQP